jgi:hypothetical protein
MDAPEYGKLSLDLLPFKKHSSENIFFCYFSWKNNSIEGLFNDFFRKNIKKIWISVKHFSKGNKSIVESFKIIMFEIVFRRVKFIIFNSLFYTFMIATNFSPVTRKSSENCYSILSHKVEISDPAWFADGRVGFCKIRWYQRFVKSHDFPSLATTLILC